MSDQQNKKKKRPPLLAAIVVTLLMILVLIVTMAMLASKDMITNPFEAGTIDISLLEPSWNETKAKNIVPGTVLNKDPQVINRDKQDVYVFLKVTIPCAKLQLESNSDTNKGAKIYDGTDNIPLYRFLVGDARADQNIHSFDQTVRGSWKLVEQNYVGESQYYYVYGYKGSNTADALEILHQGDVTQKLFDKVELMNINEVSFDKTRDYSIYVEAIGIQANYLGDVQTNDPVAVWGKVTSN